MMSMRYVVPATAPCESLKNFVLEVYDIGVQSMLSDLPGVTSYLGG